MPEISNEDFNHIKHQTELRFGSTICYVKQCILLEQDILKKTKRAVSNSTLKRFFGLVNSNNNPSKYTLDTLSIYVGFNDWDDFKTNEQQTTQLHIELSTRISDLSEQDFRFFKQNIQASPIILSDRIKRTIDQLSDTPLRTIQISGYSKNGRKQAIALLKDELEKSGTSVWFVDLFHPRYNALWASETKPDISLIFPSDIEQMMKQSNIPVVCIIELSESDLQHTLNRQKRIHKAIQKHFERQEQTKIIFSGEYTCDIHLPDEDTLSVSGNEFFYTDCQLDTLLEKNTDTECFSQILLFPFLRLLMKQPDFFHFFQQQKPCQNQLQTVVNEYLLQKYYSHDTNTPNLVVNNYLYFTKYGSKGGAISAGKLLNDGRVPQTELNKFIRNRTLKEKVQPHEFAEQDIAFEIPDNWVLSYLSTQGWIKNNGISQTILEPLMFYYKHKPDFLILMLRWFMFYAYIHNIPGFFEKILSKTYQFAYRSHEIHEKNLFFNKILYNYFLTLRHDEKFRAIVFNKLISSQNERRLFFDTKIDIDFIQFQPESEWQIYTQTEQTEEARFRYNYFCAFKHFLSANYSETEKYAQRIYQQKYLIATDIRIARNYFFVQIIEQSNNPHSLLVEVLDFLDKYKNKIEASQEYDFYFHIIEGFALVQNWILAANVIDHLNEKLPDYLPNQNYKSYILAMIYANGLLEENKKNDARNLYNSLKDKPLFPLNEKNYWQIFSFLLKKPFLSMEKSELSHHYLKQAIQLKFFHFKAKIYKNNQN